MSVIIAGLLGAAILITLAKMIWNEQDSSDCAGALSDDGAAGCGGAKSYFPDQLRGEPAASNFREGE